MMVMQARILEKQEAVQERKARKKVLFSVLSCTSFNISHAKKQTIWSVFYGSGKDIRDTRGSTRDKGCARDEGAGDPLLHFTVICLALSLTVHNNICCMNACQLNG